MKKYSTLEEIFESDKLGLLDIKSVGKTKTEDERIIDSFQEINDFIEKFGVEPKKNLKNIKEMGLAARLDGLRKNKENAKKLLDFDVYNLLTESVKDPESIDDILSGDLLGILDTSDLGENIRTLKNVPEKREASDYVAKRRKSKDFYKFEDIFHNTDRGLRDSTLFFESFYDAAQLKKDVCFVLNGQVAYVANMERLERDQHRNYDGRTLIIFDNGTESNMLFRSLVKLMQADESSRVISSNKDQLFEQEENDIVTGHIYVLQSLSKSDELKPYKDLHKIGYSKDAPQKRIENAENDPTYLMGKVHLRGSYEIQNISGKKVERLLHRFFTNARLNIDLTDKNGDRYTPKEWFDVPLEEIEKAINLLVTGEIVNYTYDSVGQKMNKIK